MPFGKAGRHPHTACMSIQSDNPEHGFQFPGTFELSAMGPADSGLEDTIPQLLEDAGITVLRETVARRDSSGGNYVAIKLSIRADSREQYEAAHAALRAHPDVKWTL